ncbi:hypothetical protein MRX96_054445 [Rhipicephalus microplus]
MCLTFPLFSSTPRILPARISTAGGAERLPFLVERCQGERRRNGAMNLHPRLVFLGRYLLHADRDRRAGVTCFYFSRLNRLRPRHARSAFITDGRTTVTVLLWTAYDRARSKLLHAEENTRAEFAKRGSEAVNNV